MPILELARPMNLFANMMKLLIATLQQSKLIPHENNFILLEEKYTKRQITTRQLLTISAKPLSSNLTTLYIYTIWQVAISS